MCLPCLFSCCSFLLLAYFQSAAAGNNQHRSLDTVETRTDEGRGGQGEACMLDIACAFVCESQNMRILSCTHLISRCVPVSWWKDRSAPVSQHIRNMHHECPVIVNIHLGPCHERRQSTSETSSRTHIPDVRCELSPRTTPTVKAGRIGEQEDREFEAAKGHEVVQNAGITSSSMSSRRRRRPSLKSHNISERSQKRWEDTHWTLEMGVIIVSDSAGT